MRHCAGRFLWEKPCWSSPNPSTCKYPVAILRQYRSMHGRIHMFCTCSHPIVFLLGNAQARSVALNLKKRIIYCGSRYPLTTKTHGPQLSDAIKATTLLVPRDSSLRYESLPSYWYVPSSGLMAQIMTMFFRLPPTYHMNFYQYGVSLNEDSVDGEDAIRDPNNDC